MNPISSRLLNQQLVCPQFNTPAEVVSWMGAMQAQDYRAMRWAVAMRTRKPSSEAFERDFNSGRIVRTHLLRCTWQLISGEDYMWMRQLCAPKALSAMKGWMTSNKVSISPEEEQRISGIFEAAMRGKRSVFKDELVSALADEGIRMDEHRLSYHIRLAELSGLLCSGDLHSSRATWCLVSEKFKDKDAGQRSDGTGTRANDLREPSVPASKAATLQDREEALCRLATKYFQSHSPATFEDFVWWSGLNIGDCRAAVQMLGDRLHVEKWRGREFLLHESCRTRGFRKGCVHLIPPYDEYLIAYKSRDIALAPQHSHHAHNNSGIFRPVIAIDGEIVGNWSMASKDGDIDIFKDNLIIPEDSPLRRQLADQFRTFRTLW